MNFNLKELINRYRHNRGFGIQSPNAFHFVTSVLKEKHSYYAYRIIDGIAVKCGKYPPSHYRRLFRIVNFVHPENLILFAPDSAAKYAIIAANAKVPSFVFVEEVISDTECGRLLADRENKRFDTDVEIFKKQLMDIGTVGLLYIGETDDYSSIVDEAIKYVSSNSVIVVENIHFSPKNEKWWENVKQNDSVCVTFDLYSIGIMFFDKKYKKQHYALKLR